MKRKIESLLIYKIQTFSNSFRTAIIIGHIIAVVAAFTSHIDRNIVIIDRPK